MKADEYHIALAWYMYCQDTALSMDVKDYWGQLSEDVQLIYLDKAEDYKFSYT